MHNIPLLPSPIIRNYYYFIILTPFSPMCFFFKYTSDTYRCRQTASRYLNVYVHWPSKFSCNSFYALFLYFHVSSTPMALITIYSQMILKVVPPVMISFLHQDPFDISSLYSSIFQTPLLRPEFLNCSTTDILSRQAFVGGAVLCMVGYLPASLALTR